MVVILKQSFPLVLAALILVASPEATDAATRGVRGNQHKQLDSVALSEVLSERTLKKGKNKNGKDKDKNKGKSVVPNGEMIDNVDGRFDIPAPAPAPTGPTVNDWVDGCSNQNFNIDSCAFQTNFSCKQCMYALSFTSTVTPSTANGGVKACQRQYCGECTMEQLLPFFNCGYGIMNPAYFSESDILGSSIRTPPPMQAPDAAEVPPIIDASIDMENCPSVFPQSGKPCVMLAGFESKKCNYYEVGSNVQCRCSNTEPVWECTGTITNEVFVVETNDLEVTIEEQGPIAILPSTDIVFSRIEGTGRDPVNLLCPIDTPSIGDTCSTQDFDSIECCYTASNPYPDTLGTVTCTCSNGGNGGFHCKAGSLSTCTVPV